MAYCTQADMVTRFGEQQLVKLTDREKPYTGAIVVMVLDKAIADACGLIDSYMSGRYPLPLNPVPDAVIRFSADIARYYLFEQKPPDEVTERYKAAVRWLELVANGRVKLNADNPVPEAPKSGATLIAGPKRVFSRGSMDDF